MPSRRTTSLLLVPAVLAVLAGFGWSALRPAPDAAVRFETDARPAPSPSPRETALPAYALRPAVAADEEEATDEASDEAAGDATEDADDEAAGEAVTDEVSEAAPTPSPTPTEDEPDYDVPGVQQRLADLGYYGGAVDGDEGPGTVSAVMAFQKVNGLAVDGVVGPATLAAIEDPVTPSLRGGESTRIEVDLDRQVLYVVRGGELARILPISSGNGESYETRDGGTARSLTPVGSYRIERRIRGEREADLGTLYDPLYFFKGWAVHGSNSVPAYPASHGCVRVTRADALYLFEAMADGTQVLLYGGTHTFGQGAEEAAGTDTPAGDTAADTAPAPAPDPTPAPAPAPAPAPDASPAAEASPSPAAAPAPDASPSPEASPGEA